MSTGQFLGFYETIGYLVVRRDEEEQFLNYGYCEENPKILYSYHKRRIPNSFRGTLFNRHRMLSQAGQLKTDFSNTYFFLSSVTDRSESINQHMGSVNLTPIDLVETLFEAENGIAFNLAKLDITCDEKKVMTNAMVKMLKRIADISNSSIVKNADGLLSKKPANMNVEWVGKTKRLPSDKYKVSY